MTDPPLSECERIDLDTGIEERDLERALTHVTPLPDERVEARFDDQAIALLVHVDPVIGAGGPLVDQYSEPDGCHSRGRRHDEMQVARRRP